MRGVLFRSQRWATEIARLIASSEVFTTIGGGFDFRFFLLDWAVVSVRRAGLMVFFFFVFRGRFWTVVKPLKLLSRELYSSVSRPSSETKILNSEGRVAQ